MAITFASNFGTAMWIGIFMGGLGLVLILTSLFWQGAGYLDRKTSEALK